MTIAKELFDEYIKAFDFKGLFNYLGWDNTRASLSPIQVNNHTYTFKAIAHKSSFLVVQCVSDNGLIPKYTDRSRIDNELRKQVQEHMLIFCDSENVDQLWLYSYRFNGKMKKSEVLYNISQDTERLYERAAGLFFNIDEQDNITIFDVTQRMTENFAVNSEKVTKKFYDGFKKQHSKFIEFMDGVTETMDKEWYASIMLNRLMFCYFIQKRGFLDNDKNYLRNKLNECMEQKGKDIFYSFYRNFLLILFHNGFAEPTHNNELTKMIGQVPYLNGGIFDVHYLEKKYPDININDEAFIEIFDFFDTYEWYLDSRECASGNEISPDVLGYIFEKYINDRAKMGAYYTLEDITEYIARNAIIPYIFKAVEEKYRDIFAPNREVWTFLKNSGDKYLFENIKKGVSLDLPDYIQIGIDEIGDNLLERRSRWNEAATEQYAMPTENWREVVERRKQYKKITDKISSGEITNIQDFVEYNLDVCSFTQDLIDTIDDSAFVRAFYEVIKDVTILDPTCGSGAFLFAAINILEPLYSSCLNRMEDFMKYGEALPQNTHDLFVKTIESKNEHANKQYFIIKSIILNNLYGVDIMNEAVETTKLRLFLTLVATANPEYDEENVGIEPLPDVDFNIKCGNSLIGYSSKQEIENACYSNFFNYSMQKEIVEKLNSFADKMIVFKEKQLEAEKDKTSVKRIKAELDICQAAVNEILDKTMVSDGGMDTESFEKWKKKSQPFHWFSEFYSTISKEHGKGGFDVIIGNPPYVEYSSVRNQYEINGYKTLDCGNLYAYVLERCSHLIKEKGIIGMIVPLSGHSTDRMSSLVTKFYNTYSGRFILNLSGDANPSRLFPGVKFRLSILFVSNLFEGYFSSKYKKWYADERKILFKNIQYTKSQGYAYKNVIVKTPSEIYEKIFSKVQLEDTGIWNEKGDEICYYHNAPVSWIRSHTFTPYFCSERDGEGITTQLKKLTFRNRHDMVIASSILNSSLFYIWWVSQSDCYHLNAPEIKNFGFTIHNDEIEDLLIEISDELSEDMKAKSKRRVYHYAASGKVEYDEFYMKKSKDIIDKIDAALAKHYGFSDVEVDYITNYEIKYRMGVSDIEDSVTE